MKYLKLAILAFVAVSLFGCASGARIEKMAYTGSVAEKKEFDSSLKKAIDVEDSFGGQETNPAWTSEISNTAFTNAVIRSLSSFGLHSDNGKYKLAIYMIKVDQPIFGLDMTVTTHTRYILTDSETKSVVLDETIVAPYTATVGDAFMGFERLKLANEGSGKENIKGLIQKLFELKIKPQEVSVLN